jgi:predicted ATPase/class 3 adenylate cyclase
VLFLWHAVGEIVAVVVVQPTGTVTLVFSDIEGSTRLLERLGTEPYADVLEEHRSLLREAFRRFGGYEVDTEGDAFFVAFARADAAVAAAGAAQLGLASARWPEGVVVRVRMGVHTGQPSATGSNYVGMDVHRAARIMAAGHGGQVLISETTQALLDGVAVRDLGLHRLKDLLEPIRLYQLEIEGVAGEFPPLKSLGRTNLPLAAWPLLGRERELERIRSLISDGVRLVTLTGPGGSGKTRLALQAAGELSDDFVDGTFFVALAPLRETGAVLGTVAEAVGLEPDDDVAAWLESRRAVLVLDNLEHLAGVGAVVAGLLTGGTVLLCTSRAPLRLAGERELPVEPLPEDAAVELFVSRAAAAGRDIEPDDTVAAVCRRLDSLPLALELAAARSRLLSPAALLARLDTALPLLTGGASDRPERQRTLRATIEWSHDLLEPDKQAAFRRLSVFRGSLTLDAAEAVTDADLDQVAGLLDQSLLKPLGEERFFMLETIREYARERLEAAGESGESGLRHARFYLAQLEEKAPEMRGPRRVEVLGWFADEEYNLRAALDRLADAAPEEAARAGVLLFRFWLPHGAYKEARQRLSALLTPELSGAARARVLECLSDVEERLGHLDAAGAAGEEARLLAEANGLQDVLADALRDLAWVADTRGDTEEAIRLQSRGLEVAASVDEQRRALALHDLGDFHISAGRRKEARALLGEAAAVARAIGYTSLESESVAALARIDLADHDFDAAYRLLTAPTPTIPDKLTLLHLLVVLGWASVGVGSRHEARAALAEALDLATTTDQTAEYVFIQLLIGIAVAADPPAAAHAARLKGAANALRGQIEYPPNQYDHDLDPLFTRPLIEALGEEPWAQEQAAGAVLTLGEAIALARSLAAAPPPADAEERDRPPL